MLDNTLSLVISSTFTLTSFTIYKVIVTPNECASIHITIETDDGKLFDRVAFLSGEAYTLWETDDYIYKYIQDNIVTIFNC